MNSKMNPLVSDAPVIVYVDFKSPYAYLCLEPTRELERDLGIEFDWRPFVLDIPSYLGSARLDQSGGVAEQQRSQEQWAAVKYSYYDCRRYANLYGLTVRGTEKIWDSSLAATALLWAKQFGHETEQKLLDLIYRPFWKRELDIEDFAVLEGVLDQAGAAGSQFQEWAKAEGLALNAQLQADAFDKGIFGVPTYVVNSQLYFGREHLPRIRWQLSGQAGPEPDIANPLPPRPSPASNLPDRVVVGLDDSADSQLALPGLLNLLEGYTGDLSWVWIENRAKLDSRTSSTRARSTEHQLRREAEWERNRERYEITATAMAKLLDDHQIEFRSDGPEQVLKPARPGVVVLLDDEVFIGRQHLPLIAEKLGKAVAPD